MIPIEVSYIRREICKSARCDHFDKLDYTDPCSFCPAGHFGQYEANCLDEEQSITSTIHGLGDIVAVVMQPIAGAIDKVFGTTIKTCGGCQKRQDKLNKLIPL